MDASRFATTFEPVCDQLRTSFEPDSVIEFGFELVCDQLRAGSSYLLEGSKLVADLLAPASSLLAS